MIKYTFNTYTHNIKMEHIDNNKTIGFSNTDKIMIKITVENTETIKCQLVVNDFISWKIVRRIMEVLIKMMPLKLLITTETVENVIIEAIKGIIQDIEPCSLNLHHNPDTDDILEVVE